MQGKRMKIQYKEVQDFKLRHNQKFYHELKVTPEYNNLQGPFNSPNLLYVSKKYGYICVASGPDPAKKLNFIHVFHNQGLHRKQSLLIKGEEDFTYIIGSRDERVLVAIDRKGRAHFYDILAAPKLDRSLPLLKMIQLCQQKQDCTVIDCQVSPLDNMMLVTFSHGEIVTFNTESFEVSGRLSGNFVSALWLQDG